MPAHEWIVLAGRHRFAAARKRTTWFAPLARAAHPLPPPCLGSLALESIDTGLRSMGVIRDADGRWVAAALRVRGRTFALANPSERDRHIALWADSLAAFCKERSAVARVTWSEWAAPAGLDEHHAWLRGQNGGRHHAALGAYEDLLAVAGPLATAHEIVVTVVVDERRVRATRGEPARDAAHRVLVEELRLLGSRLEAVGLEADGPLDTGALAHIVRTRTDPRSSPQSASRRAQLSASPASTWPLAVSADWSSVRTDGGCHRTYWIAEWPSLDVRAGWLDALLLAPGAPRALTVILEPEPPSRAQRRIDRDAVRLASDEDTRERRGFRVRARDRRAAEAVQQRERELVAGHGEVAFTGLLCVTTARLDELDRACADYEQAAAQAGLQLRPLDGRHDSGWAAALPLGIGVGRAAL
jgi:hypothetical protein